MKVWIVAVLLSILIVVGVLNISRDHPGHEASVYDVNYEQVFFCLGERWDPFDPNRSLQQEINMLKFCVISDPHSR